MKRVIDIETYPNRFVLGVSDMEGNRSSYQITDSVDQREELYQFLSNFKGYWISFNGVGYDNVVLAYAHKNKFWPDKTVSEVTKLIKEFSDDVITTRNGKVEQFLATVDLFTEAVEQKVLALDTDAEQIWYRKFGSYLHYFKWIDIDLFLYWSKLLRITRKMSLKSLGIQMGYPVVQELPYDHQMYLDDSQWQEVLVYNLQHDLGILLMLVTEMNDAILLRQQIYQKYRLNCWSMDAPKIASELLLLDFCSKTEQDINAVRKWRFEKEEIIFDNLFKDHEFGFSNPQLVELYDELLKSRNRFTKTIILTNHDDSCIKITLGSGGIHSKNDNCQYFSDDEYVLIDSDIASLYPRLIELLGVFRFQEVNDRYCEIKHLRLTESKPNFKKAKLAGDVGQIQFWKLQDEFYKLVLNSTSGLIDMKHSWLYNPSMILKLRLMGQMILLRCIQDSINCGYQVISTNTDGLTVRLLRSQLDAYQNMIDSIGNEFGVEFEHDTFKSIHYQNVNSYIAVCENGIIKKKGSFLTKPELGLSVDNLVVAKLLQCYFVSGITPEQVLANIDTFTYAWDKKITKLGIFDFCASQKVDKSYQVVWNGKPQQRLNRYYVSKRGAYLYKTRNGRSAHMLKGFGVMIYNNHIDKPINEYPIDMAYYINEANKIIFAITKANQLTLF